MTQTATPTQETREVVRQQQRTYLLRIREELKVPPLDGRPSFEDCTEAETQAVTLIEQNVIHGATRNAMDKLFKMHANRLKRILDDASRIEVVRSEVIVPELKAGLLPQELAMQTGEWFRKYEQFSERWARRSYQAHHKGAAYWLASTVAGGRAAAVYGGLKATPLYIGIVSPSSKYTKTTAIKIATDLLDKAGLRWKLSANTISPEKLLSNMAGKFAPSDWETLTEEEQAIEQLKLGHAGQVGWNYPEFGDMLREIANKNGRNAPFKAVLLRMDDGEAWLDNDTHKRGRESIERPYLALIGTMTPDHMKEYAPTESSLWTDGTYGRFGFCCPPPGKEPTAEELRSTRMPPGEMDIRSEFITPLVDWDRRLGRRYCRVYAQEGEKGNKLIIERGDFPLTKYPFEPGVQDALEDYGDALILLSHNIGLKQFDSSYVRLKDKALRIALLAASLEGSTTIGFRHIAFGQYAAEDFREGLHHLALQIKECGSTGAERLKEEETIVQYVETASTWLTSRLMRRNKFKDMSPEDLELTLQRLVRSGDLICKKTGKTEYFTDPLSEETKLFPERKEK